MALEAGSMSRAIVHLTDKTVTDLRSEYGPIMTPPSSLNDLINGLLQRHVQGLKDARRIIDENTPVIGCD
jgi:hypothetical protein